MPWQDGTLTVEDVSAHVGAPPDPRMILATDSARAMGQRRRSVTLPLDLWSDPLAHDGGVRYAGLLWRSRSAPAGFASYEPVDTADYTEYARAMDHLGLDPRDRLMNELTAELHTLASELQLAGVPATVDPGEVLRLVTQSGVCALLEPHSVKPGWGMATLGMECPVRLVTSGPYDHDAIERLDVALLLALPIIQPREPVEPGTWDSGDVVMPCRGPMVAHRRIPNPLLVHP